MAKDFAGKFNVVGLQETRVRESTFVVKFGWQCWSSAATGAGQLGVELWLRDDLRVAEPIVHIQDPRRLCVEVLCEDVRVAFFVAHGPTQAKPVEEIKAWWKETRALVEPIARRIPVITLCDANARLDGEKTPHFGRTRRRGRQ